MIEEKEEKKLNLAFFGVKLKKEVHSDRYMLLFYPIDVKHVNEHDNNREGDIMFFLSTENGKIQLTRSIGWKDNNPYFEIEDGKIKINDF